jgi:hypothetical protein
MFGLCACVLFVQVTSRMADKLKRRLAEALDDKKQAARLKKLMTANVERLRKAKATAALLKANATASKKRKKSGQSKAQQLEEAFPDPAPNVELSVKTPAEAAASSGGGGGSGGSGGGGAGVPKQMAQDVQNWYVRVSPHVGAAGCCRTHWRSC